MADTYESDTYGWAIAQAELLRRRSGNELDWDNIAEEIESVGKSQASELRARFRILLAHLLKWAYQPERRGALWESTIRTQRAEIEDHLLDNPSLKSRQDELYPRAYKAARSDAMGETGLPLAAFPEVNPFSLKDALDENFWPEAPQ